MSEEQNKQNGSIEGEEAQPFEERQEAAPAEGAGPEAEASETERLRQELAGSKDQLLRLAAEFENYKKRIERERETLVKYAGESILRELLSVVDNLERAIEHAGADNGDAQQQLDALLEGVQLTHKGLLVSLEKFEVRPIESLGREFDPNVHEAMTMEASDSVPNNHVLREFVKGFRFRDRLLRSAKVAVSRGNC